MQVAGGQALFANAGKFDDRFFTGEFFQHRRFAVAQEDDCGQCQLRDFAQGAFLQVVFKALVFQFFGERTIVEIARVVTRYGGRQGHRGDGAAEYAGQQTDVF